MLAFHRKLLYCRLSEVNIRRKIRSENLYNTDEKGFSIGHAKKMKIIRKKG
jgi:hypothetical protein